MDYSNVPLLGSTVSWMEENTFDYGPLLIAFAISLMAVSLLAFGISGGQVLAVVVALAPVWLPLMLFFIFFFKWMDMVGVKYYLNQGRVTLRIKIPQEIFKSPQAMEFVLTQIHNTASPDNLMQTYLDGKRPLPMALEIVSIGGEVRFYVNVQRRKSRDAFEASMYAQYPGIEIVEEAVDYAAEIPLDRTEDYDIMSFHMNKKKDEVYPIKSYIDYELDRMPKEEEKDDPITPTLERLASIRPYERLYIQILCIAHRKKNFKHGQLSESPTWDKTAAKVVDELMRRDPETKGPIASASGESDFDGMPRITPGERSTVEKIERHMGKYAFETNIRWMYITKKDHFNGDLINPMLRTFAQYDGGSNQIGVKWRTDFVYKDIIPGGKRKELAKLKRQELKEYKLRKCFPKDTADGYKIFTTEEIATMFHLPGRVAYTPTIERIPSTRSEAPPNLPTGSQVQS